MNNRLLMSVFIGAMLTASACTVRERIITERPPEVVYERPIAPSAGYIWIDGDWYWSGGRYQWRHGHWDRPRNGRRWVGGTWESSGRGYRWRHGQWRR